MKKTIAFILFMSVFFGLFSFIEVSAVTEPSSKDLARAYIEHDIDYYRFWFGFNRYEDGQYQSYIGGDGTVKDGRITYLFIEGVVIVDVQSDDSSINQPLYGLPCNTQGVARSFWLSVSGRDEGDQTYEVGYFNTDLLLPGTPIVIEMSPVSMSQFISYTVPEGVDPSELVLLTSDGARVCYDSFLGGFLISLDPLGETEYQIMDGDGIVYFTGSINPLDDGEDLSEMKSVLNLALVGGVDRVEFDDNRSYIFNRLLGGETEDDGAGVYPAHYFLVDMENTGGYMYVSGLRDLEIVTYLVVPGESEMIVDQVAYEENGNNWANLWIPDDRGKIVIEVSGLEPDMGIFLNQKPYVYISAHLN